MENIGRWLDREVRAIQPDFVWGFYVAGIPMSWYYKGLFRGLSAPRRPIILLTYDAWARQQLQYYSQDRIYVLHCSGILLNILEHKQWQQALPLLASQGAGYWLFPGANLIKGREWKKAFTDMNILESPDKLRQAIQKANEIIIKNK